MNLVLDPHVFIWWFDDPKRLSKPQQRMLQRVGPDRPAHISDITLWEIATLVSLGRLRPKIPLRDWFEAALERPYLEVYPVTPAVACELMSLPADFHKDPADRIIVSTARVLGGPLLSSDERIIGSDAVKVIG
jgi:PIN domain nuclease of toxin-antitoxin system